MLRLLNQRLPRLPVTVLNDQPLDPAVEASIHPPHRVIIGPDARRTLTRFDIIIKSPGISRYDPAIEAAQHAGVQFTSATQFWFDENPAAVTVCITGSKGKSTTSALTAAMLNRAGIDTCLCGNIGVPLIGLMDAPPPQVWVIELSSYQTTDLRVTPAIGVLLNLYPEHLDWHGSVARYYRDKLTLFDHLDHHPLVLDRHTPLDRSIRTKWRNPVFFNTPDGFHSAGNYIRYGDRRLMPIHGLRLTGRHNLGNLCAALTVCRLLDADLEACLTAAGEFVGLPHRLQFIGAKENRLYVDDSIATIPEAAMAAVAGFPGRPVTLLAGGYDRGLPLDPLANFLLTYPVFAVVTMPESGRRLAATLRRQLSELKVPHPPQLHAAADLAEAVAIARRITPAGGVILLSPAAPSYGAFTNFEQRGQAFARLAGLVK